MVLLLLEKTSNFSILVRDSHVWLNTTFQKAVKGTYILIVGNFLSRIKCLHLLRERCTMLILVSEVVECSLILMGLIIFQTKNLLIRHLGGRQHKYERRSHKILFEVLRLHWVIKSIQTPHFRLVHYIIFSAVPREKLVGFWLVCVQPKVLWWNFSQNFNIRGRYTLPIFLNKKSLHCECVLFAVDYIFILKKFIY